MHTNKQTLSHYILRQLLNTFTVVWLLIAPLTYLFILKEVDEVFNNELQNIALGYTQLERTALIQLIDNTDKNQYQREEDDRFAFFVWDQAGNLIKTSQEHPSIHLSAHSPHQFMDISEESRWRVYFPPMASGLQLAVARKLTERDESARNIALGLFIPWLAFLISTIVIVVWGLRKNLLPIDQLIDQLTKRHANDLTPLHTPPLKELQPLTDQINQLFKRLEHTRTLERAFTANAAHELKTPLSAMLIHIASALEQSPSNKVYQHIQSDLSRMQNLVTQLLLLAKLDEQIDQPPTTPIQLQPQLWQAISQHMPMILEKNIDISFETSETANHATIMAHGENLAIVWENLLRNAITHTPDNGKIRLSLNSHQHAWEVEIVDSGKGVDLDKQQDLGQRFWRDHDNTTHGSGLGLSICKQIIEQHQGSLIFSSNTDPMYCGLLIKICLPKI